MSDQTELSYAARITISLPGSGEKVTMSVMLWPEDSVDVDGIIKPLGACTLADLERFAQELEADVWETYETIVLLELNADDAVDVDVRMIDDEDQPVADWQDYSLVFSTSDEDKGPSVEEEPALAEEVSVEEVPKGESPVDEEEPQEDAASVDEAESEVEELPAPDVAVADAELVYPEIEEEVDAEDLAPEIIPSQARVRVAGGRRPIGDPTWEAVDILMDEPALRAAQAHALSSLHREVAGILIGGRPEKQPDGRYVVHVFDTIVARHTVMQGASVTYTPESWRYLNDTLAEKYPDDTAVMVGWYHTHPGFGIFLSGMDLFIHQNFFTQIWHVAMVLDPRARTSGFFCWDRQKTRVSRCDFAWPPWAAGSW